MTRKRSGAWMPKPIMPKSKFMPRFMVVNKSPSIMPKERSPPTEPMLSAGAPTDCLMVSASWAVAIGLMAHNAKASRAARMLDFID